MSTTQGNRWQSTNRLLGVLPQSTRDAVLAVAERMPFPVGLTMVEQGAPFRDVYFPHSGVISLLITMSDGRGVDAATVGYDGMVGAELVLGVDGSPYEVTVQVEGYGLRVPTDDFLRLMKGHETLRQIMLQYVGLLIVQASRSAACNRLHDVEERMARWLLHSHDWTKTDTFHITQEFIATLLGVRRSTVTIAAGILQRAGLITYRRGNLTILDRTGLENVACEDYLVVRDAFEHAFEKMG